MSNVTVLSNELRSIVVNTTDLITNGYYSHEPRHESKKGRSSIFEAIMNSDKYPVFAELKFSTPTNDLLKESSTNAAIEVLNKYTSSSIAGISILTEPKYFHGSLEYLDLATSIIDDNIPILMKDFIISKDQIICAKNFGASTILLISKILSDEMLQKLLDYAHELDLEVLLEVNDLEELRKALKTTVQVIGINNRNLSTMKVSLDTTEELLASIEKADKKILSLSGINSQNDVIKVRKAGADGILVGTALMKSKDPKGLINQFSEV